MPSAVRRAVLLVVAATALVAVLAGLARLGLALPGGPAHAPRHGPLFVLGVFVTVIALERAVAYGKAWAYGPPIASAASAVLLLAGAPGAEVVSMAAGGGLVAVNVAIVRRQREPFTALMLLGSLALLLGSIAWFRGAAVFEIVPAWVAFFVLTIVAERLELSRLGRAPAWAGRLLVVLSVLLASVVAANALGWREGPRAAGILLAAIAVWQLRFDLARRTVRTTGLPRFSATGVLLGGAWLFVGGVVATGGLPPAGPRYDAFVHAVMIGFVLSTVFAHAPIILPAVARVAVPFHPALYAPLALLELGLVARVAGDLLGSATARTAGGASNALAIVFFLVTVLWARRRVRAPRGRPATR